MVSLAADAVCVGGPHDGGVFPLPWGEPVVWLDGDGVGWDAHGVDRYLYRRVSRTRLEFVGHVTRRCGCGALVAPAAGENRAGRCPLCGSTL